MSEKTPTLVTLYAWGTGEPVRVAEFRLTEGGTVELTVIDPDEAALAQDYYDHGVDVDGDRRTVPPNEGPEFMRGLLTPRRLSYYNFADESDIAENPE